MVFIQTFSITNQTYQGNKVITIGIQMITAYLQNTTAIWFLSKFC